MINWILVVGSTTLLAAPITPKQDLTSFRTQLEESRVTMVRSFAQFSKAFDRLTKAQKEQILMTVDGSPYAEVVESMPKAIGAINQAIINLGGNSMTVEQFRDIEEEENNK